MSKTTKTTLNDPPDPDLDLDLDLDDPMESDNPSDPDPDLSDPMDSEDMTTTPPRATRQKGFSSPDPLSMDFTPAKASNKAAISRKRLNSTTLEPQRTPQPPSSRFSFLGASVKPMISSVKEGIQVARDVLVQAANLASSNDEQTRLLDLIEILRDYTEHGRVRTEEKSILASQITRLDVVTKGISKALNSQPKATSNTVSPSQTNLSQQPNPAPAPSYANAATKDLPKSTEWTIVASKKKATPPPVVKNNLSSRQLILTQNGSTQINSLALRNKINDAFASNGVKSPVIVSVSLSFKKNIVLTTTPTFNAKYLLENKDIWTKLISFQEALPITPWFKVAIHGIPTDLDNLGVIKTEIRTFNNGLQVVGEPYWLSHESNRRIKQAGTVCVAFSSQKDADYAIRNRLYLFGISVRAEKLHSTPPSTQCQNCQKFGHAENRCQNLPACKICSEHHFTRQHKCNTCNAKGKVCIHTIRRCVNCKEAHTADDKLCEVYLATKARNGPQPSNAHTTFEC